MATPTRKRTRRASASVQSTTAPTKRRKRRGPLNVREARTSFNSGRARGETYIGRFRRLLPLDPRDLASIHRWLIDRVKANNRRKKPLKWFFASFLIRTLGPLYESKAIEPDSDEWSEQWLTTYVKGNREALISRFDELLEKVDLLTEGRPAWMQAVRITFFDTKQGAPLPNTPEWSKKG